MKKKIIIMVIVFVGIIALILINNQSYALSDDIKEKDWNIYFGNLQTSIVNGSAYVPDGPELESTSIKAYDVLISKRGDYATFTFDIVNSGDIDAKLETFNKIEPKCISLSLPGNTEDEELVCRNLEYYMTYTKNNKAVSVNDIVKAHSKENITLKVGLSNNIESDPTNDVQITLFDTDLIFNHVN